MRRRSEYYTLIASLPPLPAHFEAAGATISQPRLDDRLSMLTPRDRKTVGRLARFLRWERLPMEQTDKEVFHYYQKIMEETEVPLARLIVATLTDIRMIVAALRKKARGLPPPEVTVGQWGRHILLHWERPGFGLDQRHPWIREVETLIRKKKVMEAEKKIRDVMWRYLSDLAQYHYFDFEAVILYLARWDVLNGWRAQDRERGVERLRELERESMGEHGTIFH